MTNRHKQTRSTVKEKTRRASLNANCSPFSFPGVIRIITLIPGILAAGQIAAQLRRSRKSSISSKGGRSSTLSRPKATLNFRVVT
jgi:hypothetical protein